METIHDKLQKERIATASSILNFPFNSRRCRLYNGSPTIIKKNARRVVYWMNRDQRVDDNWALLFAQGYALNHGAALSVLFCLDEFYGAPRQVDFMLRGLVEVEERCIQLNIEFDLILENASEFVLEYIIEKDVDLLVTDFSPLRNVRRVKDSLISKLKQRNVECPVYEVDAYNVIPAWIASDKQESMTRNMRTKITDLLPEFLTPFPPVVYHMYGDTTHLPVLVDSLIQYIVGNCKGKALPVTWAVPGSKEALEMLQSFTEKSMRLCKNENQDPTKKGLTNIWPWRRFGQISCQRMILLVNSINAGLYTESFIDECVIRKELSENFCYYQQDYDNLDGSPMWAKETLDLHRHDKRDYIYSYSDLEKGKTHDPLWNAAQNQMVLEGKMHGYMRMYWSKKLLEWTKQPEDALDYALLLNNEYSLDAYDPVSYTGLMWSICGLHDQGWQERPIFGKVRYMSFNGCRRRFDINNYIDRYTDNNGTRTRTNAKSLHRIQRGPLKVLAAP